MTYKYFCEQLKAIFIDIAEEFTFEKNEVEYRAYLCNKKIMIQGNPYSERYKLFFNGSFAGYVR